MSGCLEVRDWQRFLSRYQRFSNESTQTCFEAFKGQFERLKAAWQLKAKLANELGKMHGGDFNLFRLLGVERREVATHSALLADLFDPNGTHGQREVFLEVFLRYCSQRFGDDFPARIDQPDKYTWLVDRERVTAFGNMDLVISCPEIGLMLVLENKVDAAEQTNQLERYARWMHGQRNGYPHQLLIYLTPDGRESVSAHGIEYCRMSYRQDMAAWLRLALPGVRAPRIRETILQYIEILENI